jgi:creatinine amidohydrolase
MIAVLRFVMLMTCLAGWDASAAATRGADGVFLEDLTWMELRAQIRTGKTTIIIPIGGTEQNGPHMTLGKHNIRVKALAEKVARRLGDAIVAPVIAYVPEGSIDPPTAHMRFAGTVTISERTFEAMLESAAQSFRQHGFRDIVLLGDHGGYQKSLRTVADRLNRSWPAATARAHAVVDYYRLAETDYAALLLQKGFGVKEIGTHAGLADTSLMLAIDPDSVRTDIMASSAPSTADGVYGDPRRSSAELGETGVDVIVAGTADAIRKAVARR